MFALVERYIGAKTIELSKSHALGDQVALEALIRFADEELKHQRLFRKLEGMAAKGMPDGYAFVPDPNEVADAVLAKSNWAVLGLTLDIEIFSQAHYRASIEPDTNLSDLWKDVFLFHWKEESQHAIMDEIEWRAEDARVDARQRDQGVTDLIALVGAVDGIVQAQAGLRCALLHRVGGPDVLRSGAGADRADVPARVPLAVHRQRGAGAAVCGGAEGVDDAGPDGAHRGRADADRVGDGLTRQASRSPARRAGVCLMRSP
jgi:hypothetical protein